MLSQKKTLKIVNIQHYFKTIIFFIAKIDWKKISNAELIDDNLLCRVSLFISNIQVYLPKEAAL